MTPVDVYREKKIDHIINVEFPGYIRMLENIFDFTKWGFRRFFSGDIPNSYPCIVYASENCRVRFQWEVPDVRDTSEITYITYGRIHAPVDQEIINWNGERYYCWHNVNQALNFLDGVTPYEAFKNPSAPSILSNFHIENKTRGWRQSEMQARKHAAVWKHYGQGLFNLFDVGHPELWQKYSDYLKIYYEEVVTWKVSPEKTPRYKVF